MTSLQDLLQKLTAAELHALMESRLAEARAAAERAVWEATAQLSETQGAVTERQRRLDERQGALERQAARALRVQAERLAARDAQPNGV